MVTADLVLDWLGLVAALLLVSCMSGLASVFVPHLLGLAAVVLDWPGLFAAPVLD